METLTLICLYYNEFFKSVLIYVNIFVVHKLKNRCDLTVLRL